MMLQLFPKPFLISFCFLVCVVLLRYDISDSDEISAPTECLAVKKTLVSCYIISNVNACYQEQIVWVSGVIQKALMLVRVWFFETKALSGKNIAVWLDFLSSNLVSIQSTLLTIAK